MKKFEKVLLINISAYIILSLVLFTGFEMHTDIPSVSGSLW